MGDAPADPSPGVPVRVIADPGMPQDRIYLIGEPLHLTPDDRLAFDPGSVVMVNLGGVEPDPPFFVREVDSVVLDPLVAALVDSSLDKASDEYWGDDEHGETHRALAARLSAVITAARGALTDGDRETRSAVRDLLRPLRDALAAADGAA